MFRKATQLKSPAKILLAGASGSGKTYTALKFAFEIVKDWDKVYFIDSEKTASKYSTLDKPFNLEALESYSHKSYLSAIKEGKELAGKDGVLVIDSITHLWTGKDGLLAYQKELSKTAQYAKNQIGTWSEITPLVTEILEEIKNAQCPVIVTVRTKDKMIRAEGSRDYVKVPDQIEFRPGTLDYEFDVVFMLEQDHTVTCYKDRTGFFDGMDPRRLTPDDVDLIVKWSQTGTSRETVEDEYIAQLKRILSLEKIDQKGYDERIAKLSTLQTEQILTYISSMKRVL